MIDSRFGRVLALAACVFMCSSAQAFRFQLGDLEGAWTNRVVAGATWRVEEREPAIIGKLNLNPNLCPEDTAVP